MDRQARGITGQNRELPLQVVASSSAPITEPHNRVGRTPATGSLPGGGTEQAARPAIRPLSPTEAERRAKETRTQRDGRTQTGGHRVVRIPALPPAPKPPVRFTPIALIAVQMLLDVVAIAGAFAIAYFLRLNIDVAGKFVEPEMPTYLAMLVVTVATVILTFYFSRLYVLKRGASRVDEFYKIAAAVSMGTVLSLATNSLILGDKFVYSRQILLTGWVLSIVLVTLLRIVYGVTLGELRKHGVDRWRVLVVGTGPTAAMVVRRLMHNRTLGYHVIGAVDENTTSETPGEQKVADVPVVGTVARLADAVRKYKADEVIVALTGASGQDLRDVIAHIKDETVSVRLYPDAFQLMTQNDVSVAELSGLPLLSVKDVSLRGINRYLKRAFDIVFSLTVLVITSPLMLLIAIIIKLTSPGPVFFIQERVGLDNKPFMLVKFRSMRVAPDPEETPRLKEGMPGWTVRNDPRRTHFGAFIRRFSLDELPQFYNVLIGEMSVVGPRPEQPEYVQEFAQRIEEYLRRHREKAGLTGWAQVNGLRGDSSIEARTAADIYYVENWSILFDLKIIFRTVVAMFFGKNAY